jgi:predicted ATP-dependent endonuclease of OLD family
VVACYEDGCKIVISANTETVFARLFDSNSENVKTKGLAARLHFDCLEILPQIGLIKEVEQVYSQQTVAQDRSTYRSSRHFRNELTLYKSEYFQQFKELAESTWKGLQIVELTSADTNYQLLVRDDNFTTEIGMMGSGLQMWLQIIWFLCKCSDASTIILDEPDVYMHPDMQKRVLSIAIERFMQVVIATHSIEIISEVEPTNIVTIDKNSRKMKYANSSKAVQAIIDNIGSQYNLALTKIQSTKRCLFVEGKDAKLLSRFDRKLDEPGGFNIEDLPCTPLGGFSKLRESYGASKLFHEESQGEIRCFCILDRDFHTDDEISTKMREAAENHLILHVWQRKEIENYLINPQVLYRLIARDRQPTYSDFISHLNSVLDSFRTDVTDSLAEFLHCDNSSWSLQKCNQKAREQVEQAWLTLEGKIAILPGKEALRKIREWMKAEYNASCSDDRIIRYFKEDEIDPEIQDVIRLLETR